MVDSYHTKDGKLIVDLGASDRAARANAGRKAKSEYGNIDLASGFPASEIWTTKDGRRIAIPNMTDSHLLNTMAWMVKQIPRWKRKHGFKILLNQLVMTSDMMFQDLSDDTKDDIHHELSGEFENFMNLDDDAFLDKYVPIYGKMYREAYKRKILMPTKAIENDLPEEEPYDNEDMYGKDSPRNG